MCIHGDIFRVRDFHVLYLESIENCNGVGKIWHGQNIVQKLFLVMPVSIQLTSDIYSIYVDMQYAFCMNQRDI